MQALRHSLAIRVLHWAVALMVIAALVMSTFIMARIPDEDPEKMASALRHMSVGLLICLATLARLFWRRRSKRLPALSSGMGWADVLAGMVHRGLDLLVLTMILSGAAMALQTGLPLLALRGEPFPNGLTTLYAFTVHRLEAGVLGGALLAFIISMDDLVITYFIAGVDTQTLPIFIFGMLRRGIKPEVNAIAVMMLLFSFTVASLGLYLRSRNR